MIDKIIQVYHDMVLLESLDRPYELEDVTKHLGHQLPELEKHGFNSIRLYSCVDEPGHAFMTGYRGGAFEIHHQHMIDGIEMQGQKNILGKTPTRFVSTAFNLIRPELESGKDTRIIAPEAHISAYHRLATVIGKKYGYRVTEPYKRDDGDHVFSIGKNPSPLFGMPPIRKPKS